MKKLHLFLALFVTLISFASLSYADTVDTGPIVAQADSVSIDSASEVKSPAPLAVVMNAKEEAILANDSIIASIPILIPFYHEIDSVARAQGLPPALIAAFVQNESGFNPWATRTEPHYTRNVVVQRGAKKWSKEHGGSPSYETELADRSQSFGLMQPMGEVVRENGFKERYLAALYLPINSLTQGCIHLKKKMKIYGIDTASAISAYNQGNNRKSKGRDGFENSRYVWKMHVSWRNYEKLFSSLKSSTHDVKTTITLAYLDSALSDSTNSVHDSVYTQQQQDSIQVLRITYVHKADTSQANEGHGDSTGLAQAAFLPSDSTSNQPLRGLLVSASTERKHSESPFGFYALLTLAIGAGIAVVIGFIRGWSRYDEDIAQPFDGPILGLDQTGTTKAASHS